MVSCLYTEIKQATPFLIHLMIGEAPVFFYVFSLSAIVGLGGVSALSFYQRLCGSLGDRSKKGSEGLLAHGKVLEV
jgi:hypothetical protein